MIFAYFGPSERKPVLPRYECLEVLDDGEFVEADDSSIGSGGPQIVPCNWLQHFENVVDPFHVIELHTRHSGPQFTPLMGQLPEWNKFDYTPLGVIASSVRRLPDGGTMYSSAEVVLPTLRVVPNPRAGASSPLLSARVESIGWTLPIDDTHFRIYVAGRVRKSGEMRQYRSRQGGKLWEELTAAEHQKFPGDYEAQTGQGAITSHAEENLTTTDQGIGMLRHLLRRQLEVIAKGGDPVGVSFDQNAPAVKFDAGRELRDAAE